MLAVLVHANFVAQPILKEWRAWGQGYYMFINFWDRKCGMLPLVCVFDVHVCVSVICLYILMPSSQYDAGATSVTSIVNVMEKSILFTSQIACLTLIFSTI